VQKLSFRSAAKTLEIDVGTAMAWAAKEGMSVPRRPSKLTGEIRSQVIIDLKKGADKVTVAAQAKVSVVTITKLLLSEVGLHAAWCQSRRKRDQAAARGVWRKLLLTHRGLGIKFMRSLEPAAYAWLYRNDRVWLDMRRPNRQSSKTESGESRVMWDARDETLSEEIKRAALTLQMGSETPRIKLWQIYQAVPALKAKLASLERLPLTRRAIDNAMRRPHAGTSDADLFD
jgi:hypothetical protein